MERDRTYLFDILEASQRALSYVEEKTQAAFLEDIQCQDSVIRRLEIIGETARRISEPFRLAHTELPWNEMVGMRNLLIHEYDDVDFYIVWKTVVNELPGLVAKVKVLLDEP